MPDPIVREKYPIWGRETAGCQNNMGDEAALKG